MIFKKEGSLALHDFFRISDYYRNMQRLLLIEDEAPLGRLVVSGLELAGYSVDWCKTGTDGYEKAKTNEYAAILLDLMLPGMDGWTVCRRLRDRRLTTPILMLTALDEIDERVRGLEMGADDYLPKPFAFDELKARIAALIRRSQNQGQRRRRLRIADLEIDTEKREAKRSDMILSLTPREYDLLEKLARREGYAVTREEILTGWGDGMASLNTVDVHIAALRRKVDANRPAEERLIQTVHRRGYALRSPQTEGEPNES